MTLIEYIGKKPVVRDTVAGTGIVWAGHGDIQPVDDKAVPALLHHSGMWRVAQPAAESTAKTLGGEQVPNGDDEVPGQQGDDENDALGLDTMNDEELKSFAKTRGLNTQPGVRADLRKKGDELRESVLAALEASMTDAEAGA